jgi:hypothetical protein
MARRVFFAFHYEEDIWRVNQVRQANVVAGVEGAGFYDHSEYEDAKRLGVEGIKRLILRHLENTTVTVLLIGRHTAARPWVRFEIAESIKRRNGLVGIYIHHLRTPWDPPPMFLTQLEAAQLPPKPFVPAHIPFPAYKWDPNNLPGFAAVIEEAGKRADAWRARAQGLLAGLRPPGGFLR